MCVFLFVSTVRRAKTAEQSEMALGEGERETCVGPKPILDDSAY